MNSNERKLTVTLQNLQFLFMSVINTLSSGKAFFHDTPSVLIQTSQGLAGVTQFVYPFFCRGRRRSSAQTYGHLCRWGRLLGSSLSIPPRSTIFERTGGLYSPPVSARSYFLASRSRSFFMDCFEWTPYSLPLSFRISAAICEATRSSTVRLF